MSDCTGCINENKKSRICSDCFRSYKDHFIYKDEIVKRYAVMKGNVLLGMFSSMTLAKKNTVSDKCRIAKMVEVR